LEGETGAGKGILGATGAGIVKALSYAMRFDTDIAVRKLRLAQPIAADGGSLDEGQFLEGARVSPSMQAKYGLWLDRTRLKHRPTPALLATACEVRGR
jgi:hypothetical protein